MKLEDLEEYLNDPHVSTHKLAAVAKAWMPGLIKIAIASKDHRHRGCEYDYGFEIDEAIEAFEGRTPEKSLSSYTGIEIPSDYSVTIQRD